jgi:hypothetical protein
VDSDFDQSDSKKDTDAEDKLDDDIQDDENMDGDKEPLSKR